MYTSSLHVYVRLCFPACMYTSFSAYATDRMASIIGFFQLRVCLHPIGFTLHKDVASVDACCELCIQLRNSTTSPCEVRIVVLLLLFAR